MAGWSELSLIFCLIKISLPFRNRRRTLFVILRMSYKLQVSKIPCPICRRKSTALLVMSEQPLNRSKVKEMKFKEDNRLNDSKQQLCTPCKCISQCSYIFFAVLAVKIDVWLRGYAVVQQRK